MSWNNTNNYPNWSGNQNNNINSNQLISSITGLTSSINITVSKDLISTVTGLGTAGYISSTQFQSTNSVFISLFSTLFGSTITGDTALWASYPALTSVNLNNHDIGNVRLFTASNIYGVSITSTSNLNTNTISSSQIYTSSISTGFLSLSTIGGVYGKYLSTTLGNLSNASTTTDNVKNWANYKAVTDVNFDYHNGYNLANTQTNSLTVGNGGQVWSGNAQFNQTGNTFAPYYYNFVMDANVTVANSQTSACPTYTGYYSNYYLASSVYDIESALNNFAFTTCEFNMSNYVPIFGIGIVKTGSIKTIAHNYRLISPLTFSSYDFRGSLLMGTTGSGPRASIGINQDSITGLVPDTSALIEINADTAYSIQGVLLPSRITVSGGENQVLGTFSNQLFGGYAQIPGLIDIHQICAILQYAPFGAIGGGIQVSVVNGGPNPLGSSGLGARNDLVANNWKPKSAINSEMNIFCTDDLYVYTEGDTYIGYGGENPRYGENRTQKTHVYEVQDIVGRTDDGDIGMDLLNVQSVQAYTSNSMIKNFRYLVGYNLNFAYPNEYKLISTPIISSVIQNVSTISTITYSTISGRLYSSINVSSYFTSTIGYTSTYIINQRNVSSYGSTLNQYDIGVFNYLQGISTILSSFTFEGKANLSNINITNSKSSSNDYNYLYDSNVYVPSNTITPAYLNYGISSIDSFYTNQISNSIDLGNTTLVTIDGSNYNEYDTIDNNCYTQAFYNNVTDIINPVLVRFGFGDSSGYADFYNTNPLPLYIVPDYPVSYVGFKYVPSETNCRVYVNPATSNVVISNLNTIPVLFPSTIVSSFYKNITSITQNISSTFFNVDLSGYDNNNSTISGAGSIGFNNVNISNVNASTIRVNDLYTTNLLFPGLNPIYAPPDIGILSIGNTTTFNYNNIQDVDTITVDNIYNNSNAWVTIDPELRVNTINPNGNDYVDFPGNGIRTDFLTAYSNPYVGFNTDINLLANNIIDINYIQLKNNSILTETNYGGSNYLLLSNDTIVLSNLVILDEGITNATLTFNNGRQISISQNSNGSNFIFSCNIDMSNNNISNVNDLNAGYVFSPEGNFDTLRSYTYGGNITVDNPFIMNAGINLQSNSISNGGTITTSLINTKTINTNLLSSGSIFVSTVNNKPLNFNSTLFGVPQSTFTISGSLAGSNGANNFGVLLYSNVKFPRTGNFGIQQKAVFSKISGGASATANGSIFYTPGRFISTFNQQDAISILPILNTTGISTFTTLQSGCYVSTGYNSYNIIYYDATVNNYTASLQLGNCLARYFPSNGNGYDT